LNKKGNVFSSWGRNFNYTNICVDRWSLCGTAHVNGSLYRHLSQCRVVKSEGEGRFARYFS